MVRALVDGEAGVGFAAVRPAGHHAERSRAMGFCLFNNVAVAAQLAIAELGVRRVLILDWDVHHGNGTAEIFRRRDDVLFASIHQAGIFPGGGALADAGSGPGFGYTINLPVPAGADGATWLSLLEHVVLPAASVFCPELVLISAGFDAHRDDPLADCQLDSDDFAHMTCHVRDFAHRVGAPVGAVLEGGYHLPSLSAGVISMMRALVGHGEAQSAAPEFAFTPRAASYVGQHWDLCWSPHRQIDRGRVRCWCGSARRSAARSPRASGWRRNRARPVRTWCATCRESLTRDRSWTTRLACSSLGWALPVSTNWTRWRPVRSASAGRDPGESQFRRRVAARG
jgi:hypothetical protein